MDPFSIIGIMILVIIVLFAGKIVSFLARIFFVILVVLFFFILFFGISLDQVLDWVTKILLLTI